MTKKPYVLALCGKKGSGKSTAARLIQDLLGVDRCRVRGFADPLKEICVDVLGLDRASCYGTEDEKNRPTHIAWSQWPGYWDSEDSEFLDLHPAEAFMTGREVMQQVGTHYRSIDENVWVRCLLRRVERHDRGLELVIVDDLRFPNEAHAVDARGGRVVQLSGRGHAGDGHESETAMDAYKAFDLTLDTSALTPEGVRDAVAQAWPSWGWGLRVRPTYRLTAGMDQELIPSQMEGDEP